MIIVCEPQCKGISHEKVNSGFIYGLRLAFPDEKILFFGEETHLGAIQSIHKIDNIRIDNIEYRPVVFRTTNTIQAFRQYFSLFRNLLKAVLASGTDKLFLLSFSPKILYILKNLKTRKPYQNLHFTLVLHGDFENIATDQIPSLIIPEPPSIIVSKRLISKLRKVSPGKILLRIRLKGRALTNYILDQPKKYFDRQFPTRKILLWKASTDFKYLALSPHVLQNARKYIDADKLQIYAIVLPTVFAKPTIPTDNPYVKFGIFGYGNSIMLRQVAAILETKNIKNAYEIRIIGMDNSGTESNKNITCPTPGVRLSRQEMEKYALDIDMFLILYDKSGYRLSCSGSILEALSYVKPILHFDNECICFFNKLERPIGICTHSIEEYADTIVDIINNFPNYKIKLQEFKKNILSLREEVAIENYIDQLRESFTWPTPQIQN